MARVSCFSSFIRQLYLDYSLSLDKRQKCYITTTAYPTSSTTTSLCYNRSENHNQNIDLDIQSLSRRCQSGRQLFQIQAYLIYSGLFRRLPFVASHILKLSSKFGLVENTILICQHIYLPDTFYVNTILKAYSSISHHAPLFYFRVLAKGFHPNSFTFPPLLSSCANSLSTTVGFICHAHSIKYGVNNVVPVQNSLIHMYATFGLIHSAYLLFSDMSQRDIVSWNSIIHGYMQLGDVRSAHSIFDKMPTRNVISWNIMISGYLNKGQNPGCGLKLFREMMTMGVRGTDTTFVSVLSACARSARLKEGRSVHGSLVKNLVNANLITETALIDMYSKCGRVDAARRVFDSVLGRNLVCWNAMILGYCIHGSPEDGITLFYEMIGKRNSDDDGVYSKGDDDYHKSTSSVAGQQFVLPDEITFVGVLCACARGGLLSDGKNFFNQMSSVYNIKPNFAHYWCMANLYHGVGLVQEAEQLLRNLPQNVNDTSKSSVWSSLFGLCRFRGDIELGERIAMCLIELEPQTSSHYNLLYCIYAVAGLWEKAAKVKTMIKEKQEGITCGSSLVELNTIVHEFAIGDSLGPGMDDVYTMLDELVGKLNLPMNAGGKMP